MKVIFLTMTQTYRLMKPPWCSLFTWSLSSRYVIRVLSKSFHRRPIQHNRRHKFNICSEGQANLGGPVVCYPESLKFCVTRVAISCILEEKWIVYVHKLDVASSAVSPFKVLFSSWSVSVCKSLCIVTCVQILMTGTSGYIWFYRR